MNARARQPASSDAEQIDWGQRPAAWHSLLGEFLRRLETILEATANGLAGPPPLPLPPLPWPLPLALPSTAAESCEAARSRSDREAPLVVPARETELLKRWDSSSRLTARGREARRSVQCWQGGETYHSVLTSGHVAI
jgi:hypothetical protein